MSDSTSSTLDDATLEGGRQEKNEMNEKPQECPEGGTKGWLTVAGSSAALFVTFGWLKDYSSSEIAWITSMEFFCMLFFSPVGGKIFDSYGPRIPILIGSIMHVFGLMMLSISFKYYQIMLSQSICSGIGSSLVFSPALTAAQTYFNKRRGIALGLVVAGSSVGGVIFPQMAERLILQVGFGWAVRICAFLILGMLIVANLTITSNLSHSPKPFNMMDYLRPMSEPNFCILAISSFFLYWGLFVPFNYIVTEAIYYGMKPSLATGLVSIMNGASFFGRTVPNYIADKSGRYNVMIVMLLLSTIMVLGLWLPGRSNGAIIAFAVLFGFSSGAGIGLAPVLIAGVSPIEELGFRMGAIMCLAAIGTLTSPPIAGAIIADDAGRYRFAAVFSGVNFFIATVGILLVRVKLGGWKLATKI
ncbi:Major facilitator superfamily domain general substrate transporter [Fusarium albosuccineum]|uniref:Major facilitator superfamily domain general substrate transporter n=1 Tax=Fusarium albosuccineum TaxID=1237068 RepID=A0A8H4PDJ1_9HYPO|nr:Major facilitator superfamily domain general substrate transporter [Fusarium albosuccineum]